MNKFVTVGLVVVGGLALNACSLNSLTGKREIKRLRGQHKYYTGTGCQICKICFITELQLWCQKSQICELWFLNRPNSQSPSLERLESIFEGNVLCWQKGGGSSAVLAKFVVTGKARSQISEYAKLHKLMYAAHTENLKSLYITLTLFYNH